MTKPPETRIGPVAAVKRRGRLLSPARYRLPGDIIRLIAAGLVLSGALAVTAVTHATYAGASAVTVTGLVPATLAGRVLAGLVQALFAGAAVAAVIITLRYRRYRLLADDRALQPAGNITPVARRDVVARYGTRLLTLINAVSAWLTTGSLRSFDGQVVLDGRRPRSVAEARLRAPGLMQAGGVVR